MINGLIIFHIIVCILLTIVVLIQFGKGAEAGAMMGGGSSQAIFTSSAKGNFFTKMTTTLAIAFMVNSVALTILKSKDSQSSLFDGEAPIAAPLNSDSTQVEAKKDTKPTVKAKAEASKPVTKTKK
ncbi:MAG: preprotein translocase subunit SecG [Halobacteriovoraceae bacterium]|jgi:preprotein translocase subunit SecG|nr:preprotein translocase subunit SecG [Halobacteriovoraceae bacterium]